MQANLFMPGWEIAEDLSQSSGIITLAGNAVTEVLSITIPSGGRAFIESFNARVLDAGSDQVTFSCLLNGMSIAPGYTEIQGALFDYTNAFLLGKETGPGKLVIRGTNTSAGNIRVIGSAAVFLLREIKKEENMTRYVYLEPWKQ